MVRKKKVNRITNVLDFAPFGDKDSDGAINLLDCDPSNPSKKGIYDWLKTKITPIYQKVVSPTISRMQPTITRVQRTIAPYRPTVSYQRAAQRRAAVKRKTVEVAKRVQKYLTVPEEEKRDIGPFGGTIFHPKHRFVTPTPTPTAPGVGQTGLLMGARAITPFLREKLPQVVTRAKHIVTHEIRKTPGYVAKHVFPHVKKGYDIGTGKYIAAESKALTTAQAARISQGNITAQQLGFTSEENLRAKLDAVTTSSQNPAVNKYYSDQKKVSDCYTKWVEAYYDRVTIYNKLKNPTQSQYDTLLDSKSSSTVYFETQLSKFESLYPSKPSSVVRYEKGVKPFFTPSGELKPSVLTYISKGEKEYAAFQAYEKKERETKEKWAPKYGGFTPYTLPTMEWGAKVSAPFVKGVEKVIPEKYEERGYTGVGAAKYTSLFFAGLPEWAGTVPPSAELITRKPSAALASIPLGLGLMTGGMAKLFKEKPYAGVGTLAGMLLMPYAAKKAPIRYTGAMKLPTGKPILKTSFTWGGKLPSGLVKAGKAGELVKFEKIARTPVAKVTYSVPEVLTYRGVYGVRPTLSVLPWKGIKPLTGITTKGLRGVPKPSLGAPKLDILKFQPKTGVESAVLMPSIMRGLHPSQARLMRGVFREIELIGRQKSAIRRSIDIELIEHIPPKARATVMRMLKEEKGVVFGSGAQRTQQILRRKMEDIDYFVKDPVKVAKKWVPLLNEAVGENIFSYTKRGTIQVKIAGAKKPVHAIDMHPLESIEGRLAYGFKAYKPVTIEGIKYVRLGEQLFRKGISLTTPRGKMISPELYRMKDIGDWISSAQTLTSSMEISGMISKWTRLPLYSKMKFKRAEAAGEVLKPWRKYAYAHPEMGAPKTLLKEFFPDIRGETTLFKGKGKIPAMEEIMAWKMADSGLGFLSRLKRMKIPKVKKAKPEKVVKPTEISTVIEDILTPTVKPVVKPKVTPKVKPSTIVEDILKIPKKAKPVSKKVVKPKVRREGYGLDYEFRYDKPIIPYAYPKAKYAPRRGYKPSFLKAKKYPEFYYPLVYHIKTKKYPMGKYPPPKPYVFKPYTFKPYKPPTPPLPKYEPPYPPPTKYQPPYPPPSKYKPPVPHKYQPPFVPKIIPFVIPKIPTIPIIRKKKDKIKPRRGLPWSAYQKKVVNPILQADELVKRLL